MRRFLPIAILALFLAAAGTVFAFRSLIVDVVASRAKPALPVAEPYRPVPEKTVVDTRDAPVPAPEPASSPKPPAAKPTASTMGVNLAVPFTSQAPRADWSLPFQEACEEASLIMVNAYYTGAGTFTPDEAERQIKAMVAWEASRFGFYEDTTADEVVTIAKDYLGYAHTRAVDVTSIEDVKRQIDKGLPVVLPAAGRLLRNPYFSGQGPLYHMLVVKGYTKDGKIITDDPGTRRGADYLYDPAVLWNAVHDWNGGDVERGRKVMVVVEK